MAKTYAEIKKQIAALEAEAEKRRSAETAEVVQKIRVAIETYGLTAADLFGSKAAKSKGRRLGQPAKARYSDGKGNTWVGLGKRPQWIRDALAAGANLADFAVAGTAAKPDVAAVTTDAAARPAPSKKSAGRKSAAAKKAAKVRYQDGTGNTWSGRGPHPKWLKEAIAGGKKLEDLLA